jgi:hypothetical protein
MAAIASEKGGRSHRVSIRIREHPHHTDALRRAYFQFSFGEWREGTSPSRSRRTVRKSLPSYGFHRGRRVIETTGQ